MLQILAEDGDGDITAIRLGAVCQCVTALTGAGIMLISNDLPLGSLGTASPVSIDLHEALTRRPRFGPKALAAGFRSVHALPMRLRGQTIGALNMFRAEEGAMGENDVIAAQALADVATIAILAHRAAVDAQTLNAQLTEALNTRIVIEQAKGVMSERAGLDMERAFARLRGHARNHNLRLTDVANAVGTKVLPVASLDP
ncbi:MAG: GAF and ANTAR domain-containing protein [Actinomycetota bacterium]|nr:GAF and ANTAR domain-containing protein [Actinomycetota bacterium]